MVCCCIGCRLESACHCYSFFFTDSHDICKDQAHRSISTLEPNSKQKTGACFCTQTVMPKVSFIKEKRGGEEAGGRRIEQLCATLKMFHTTYLMVLTWIYHVQGWQWEKKLQDNHATTICLHTQLRSSIWNIF